MTVLDAPSPLNLSRHPSPVLRLRLASPQDAAHGDFAGRAPRLLYDDLCRLGLDARQKPWCPTALLPGWRGYAPKIAISLGRKLRVARALSISAPPALRRFRWVETHLRGLHLGQVCPILMAPKHTDRWLRQRSVLSRQAARKLPDAFVVERGLVVCTVKRYHRGFAGMLSNLNQPGFCQPV